MSRFRNKISAERFIAAMHKVVDERGHDYVYPDSERTYNEQCQYVFDGRGACIIGAALIECGVDPDDLVVMAPARTVMMHVGVKYNEALYSAATTAQNKQDTHHTWGEALDEFDITLDRLDDSEGGR